MTQDDDDDGGSDVEFDGAPTLLNEPVVFPDPAATQLEVSGRPMRPVRFGRYTLLKRLGVGGMAEVLLAEQEGVAGFKKTCVVKKMLPHLAERPKFVEMFLREAKIAATLQHPNIVQIWDLGEVDGSYFIAMEHIDGIPLNVLARTAWKAGMPVPIEAACCAIADAAAGLAAAHGRLDAEGRPSPVIHRDISPDNLMIDRSGDTKILDFGVARANDAEGTTSGELKGKVPFMSPEHLRGHALDGRADLYSLGITAYWLLTGERPFRGPTEHMIMEAILREAPRAPIELNPTIPDGLSQLVLRLIEKDRDKRISSAQALVEMLEPMTSSRRAVVAPFVRTIMERRDRATPDDPPSVPSGFVAATPHTHSPDAWKRFATLDLTPAPAPRLPELEGPDSVDASPRAAPIDAAPRTARRLLWAALGAAAVCIGVAALVVLGVPSVAAPSSPTPPPAAPATTSTVPTTPTTPTTPTMPTTPTLPAAPPTPTTTTTPTTATTATTPSDTPAAPIERKPAHHTAPAGRREVVLVAPRTVEWRAQGRVVGTGSGTFAVPVEAKELVAVDKRRGGRTTVPIGDGHIDYGKLPHGKLQCRARPLADVFLAGDALGTTPFADVDVVAGTYQVRFVYKDKETTKTIDVAPGALARAIVDFTGPTAP